MLVPATPPPSGLSYIRVLPSPHVRLQRAVGAHLAQTERHRSGVFRGKDGSQECERRGRLGRRSLPRRHYVLWYRLPAQMTFVYTYTHMR
jgi:hypothetical protein